MICKLVFSSLVSLALRGFCRFSSGFARLCEFVLVFPQVLQEIAKFLLFVPLVFPSCAKLWLFLFSVGFAKICELVVAVV